MFLYWSVCCLFDLEISIINLVNFIIKSLDQLLPCRLSESKKLEMPIVQKLKTIYISCYAWSGAKIEFTLSLKMLPFTIKGQG